MAERSLPKAIKKGTYLAEIPAGAVHEGIILQGDQLKEAQKDYIQSGKPLLIVMKSSENGIADEGDSVLGTHNARPYEITFNEKSYWVINEHEIALVL